MYKHQTFKPFNINKVVFIPKNIGKSIVYPTWIHHIEFLSNYLMTMSLGQKFNDKPKLIKR
jgi:hypothetical protein